MIRDSLPGRLHLAFLLTTPAFLVVVTALWVSTVTLASLGGVGEALPSAGLARIGSDLALVIVTDDVSIETVRSTIANWGLLAPVAALVLASLFSWWLSGRLTETVDRAHRQVEEASEQRQAQLNDVIHELRTPLAVIGTNLELAAGDRSLASDKYLEAARKALIRMGRTVSDLEGHGRLNIEEDVAPVDLAQVAESAALEHAGPGQTQGVKFALVASEAVEVDGVDGDAVRTIVGNFMSNAMRTSPRGATVTLDWGVLEGWAWLSVSDEGAGLAPEFHARAFERGWQGSHSRDRNRGSGLGLTIARQLAEAQGGCVTLASEEGGGAVLALWLPMSMDADRGSVLSVDGVHPMVAPWSRAPSRV